MKCEDKVKTDMKAGRIKVQRGTQRTTSNPLLSHSYLHKHCNTSHRELITSNIHHPFRESQGLLFPPLTHTLRAPVQLLLLYFKSKFKETTVPTNMACIEELDHEDCIGLHSTNPPHTQCHRNRGG